MQKDLGTRARIHRTVSRMVSISVFAGLAVTIRPVGAQDLTTTTGQTYHDVQVLSRDSSAMIIQSREGSFKVALNEIKPSDREKASKDLTKAIELPAITVIGEQKLDFNALPGQSRSETLVEKEMRRQSEAREEAARKRGETYQMLQITPSIAFRLGSSDKKGDEATQPSYLNAEYQRLAPDIVEKDLRVFSLSLKNTQ